MTADELLHEEMIEVEEMANLYPKDTGIDNVVIWVNGGGDKLQHGPRIKVTRGTKFRNELLSTIPLTGVPRIIGNADLSQDEFAQVVEWIRINHDVLIAYSCDDMSTSDMIASLTPVSPNLT